MSDDKPLPDLLEGFPGGAGHMTHHQRAITVLFMAAGILADRAGDKTLSEVLTDEFARWGAREGIDR